MVTQSKAEGRGRNPLGRRHRQRNAAQQHDVAHPRQWERREVLEQLGAYGDGVAKAMADLSQGYAFDAVGKVARGSGLQMELPGHIGLSRCWTVLRRCCAGPKARGSLAAT